MTRKCVCVLGSPLTDGRQRCRSTLLISFLKPMPATALLALFRSGHFHIFPRDPLFQAVRAGTPRKSPFNRIAGQAWARNRAVGVWISDAIRRAAQHRRYRMVYDRD